MDGITEKITEIRERLEDPKFNARVTAVSVFMALYLAVGFGFIFRGWGWYMPLTWPYVFMSPFWQVVVAILTSFIAVAYYVYCLKLSVAMQRVLRLERLIDEAGQSRERLQSSDETIEAVRKDADSRVAAAEQAARLAIEARVRAEKRAADAEANPRIPPQPEKPPGTDEKFTEARRVFARLYHPENVKEKPGMSDAEKAARIQIFKEYWFELERIQKSDRK